MTDEQDQYAAKLIRSTSQAEKLQNEGKQMVTTPTPTRNVPAKRSTAATVDDNFYEDMKVLRRLVDNIFEVLPTLDSENSAAFSAGGFAARSQEPKMPVFDELEHIDFDAITRPFREAIAEGFPCE